METEPAPNLQRDKDKKIETEMEIKTEMTETETHTELLDIQPQRVSWIYGKCKPNIIRHFSEVLQCLDF